MDVDSLPIHAIEAKSKIDELLVERVDDAFGPDGIAACRALELRSFGRTVTLEQLEPICGVPVGVNIDDAARALRRRRVIVSIGSTFDHRRFSISDDGQMVPIPRVAHKSDKAMRCVRGLPCQHTDTEVVWLELPGGIGARPEPRVIMLGDDAIRRSAGRYGIGADSPRLA